jgi:ankyrin repeat protein/mono/diheme cytochrome c family protein
MHRISVLPLVAACGLVAQTGSDKLPPAATIKIDYDQHVKPILAANCFGCHGAVQQQSGLRLDLRQNAMRGGDYGVVINPGDSAASKLIVRLVGSEAGMQMPPAGPLPPEQIGILRAWIDQGADMPGRASDYAERKKTDPKTQALVDAIHRHDTAGLQRMMDEDPSLAKAVDAAGSTALMHAAYAGTVDMVRTMLAAGADPKASNSRKANALHWAITDPEKVRVLISAGAPVNAKTIEGRTPLFLSAMRPDGTVVARILLEAGADPNARTLTGATPLFPATGSSLDMVRLLLEKGADPKAKTETGATALMAAALGKPGAVALLVTRGADVKARTKRGETALANAANTGSLENVRILLENGADVNLVDYRGYTPLMHAAYCDRAPIALIRLLLDAGADIHVKGEGETALSIAAKRGETEITRLLHEAQKGSRVAAVR